MGFMKPTRIIDREDDYRKRRLNRLISPARNDAQAMVRTRVYLVSVSCDESYEVMIRSCCCRYIIWIVPDIGDSLFFTRLAVLFTT